MVNSATHRYSLTHELIANDQVRKVICTAARGHDKEPSPFETRWMAGPGIIATVGAPVSLWALYRIVADLRSGQVVTVTGTALILQEGDTDSKFRVQIGDHKVRLPFTLADMLREHQRLTAYFTPWSWMLVNITPADEGA